MPDVRVTCITKLYPGRAHEHITHLAGTGKGGWRWQWTREQVVASIRSRTNTFYVIDDTGRKSELGVVDPGQGRTPYLRTYANGEWNDALLALPDMYEIFVTHSPALASGVRSDTVGLLAVDAKNQVVPRPQAH